MSSNRHALTLLALLVLLAFAWPMAAYVKYAQGPEQAEIEPAAAVQVRPDPDDPPEVAIGERLFRETRFAQFFSTHAGSMNAPLERGDPSLGRTMTASGSPLPGTFANESMSCRACHMVGEHAESGKGSRSYTDFGRQSPIPVRDDGLMASTRNSPTAVDAALPRTGLLLHFDGEFASAEDLVRETLLGRNFGWLPEERALALHHVARVIREDDGTGALARAFGGSYRDVLGGSLSVPDRLRIPARFRMNVALASDETIVNGVAALLAEYLRSLAFRRDGGGRFDGSPYDRFLIKNRLPRTPAMGEPDSLYARRLRAALERLDRPQFVGITEGRFRLHDHPFVFGPEELRGLRVFLAESGSPPARTAGLGVGNCSGCHTPPHFTDFSFHNTGASESQYDAIHGAGSFGRLHVPDLATRNARYDAWLPPTANHPRAQGPFRSPPSRLHPGHADLGLWNVLANPDLPKPQAAIRTALGPDRGMRSPSEVLALAVACFKTPSLRDLGHSAPFFHNGRADSLPQALLHYVEFSARARAGTMRNPDPRMAGIALGSEDLRALAAFLRSLDEDYD